MTILFVYIWITGCTCNCYIFPSVCETKLKRTVSWFCCDKFSRVSCPCSCELWCRRGNMPTSCRTLCSFWRVRKCTETPLKWRWVRSCCRAMPTTVESWVLGSCWSGWTPQPACLVGKHPKTPHFYNPSQIVTFKLSVVFLHLSFTACNSWNINYSTGSQKALNMPIMSTRYSSRK